MVNGFDIREDKICIDMIQYSDVPDSEFLLNTYCNMVPYRRYRNYITKKEATKLGTPFN